MEIELDQKVVFNHSAHIRLWDWLAKNNTLLKQDWPEWKHNGGSVEAKEGMDYCLACQYDEEYQKLFGGEDCEHCPFGNFVGTGCLGGHYRKWYCSKHFPELNVKSAAIAIRDLPVREGVECI